MGVAWFGEIPEDAFAAIFRVEIDAELLQAMLLAMRDATDAKAATKRTLVALARRCPKALAFAASFASVRERAVAEELLTALEADSTVEASCDGLSAVRDALLGGAQ